MPIAAKGYLISGSLKSFFEYRARASAGHALPRRRY
jgi:hypothetical protein